MTDPAVLVAVLLSFGFVVVAASRLGAGSTLSFQGLWARPDMRDWPRGVQEADAPRFAVDHLDGLRPGTPVLLDVPPSDGAEGSPPEMVELFSRRMDQAG